MGGNPKIAVGYHWGHLTVVEPAGYRSKNKFWLCRCDCGNTVTLSSNVIKHGTTISCGCVPPIDRKKRDVTGQTFGYLTALYPTDLKPPHGFGVVWHWKCICGNEVDITLGQVTAGNNTSCGCMAHPGRKLKPGMQFGRLTLVEKIDRKRNTQNLWRCRCTCGKEVIRGQTQLIMGEAESCGCLGNERRNKTRGVIGGTVVENLLRTKVPSNNKSGVTGVRRSHDGKKWYAQIGFKRKKYHLGTFDTMEEAVKARKEAEQKLFGPFLEWYFEVYKKQEAAKDGEGADNAGESTDTVVGAATTAVK